MSTIIENTNGFTHLSDGKYSGADSTMSTRVSGGPTAVKFDTSALFPHVDIPEWAGQRSIHVNIGDLTCD